MLFSIIVPVCNGEKYLEDCVNSAISQEGDFEIILVENGSTDSSPVLCDKLSEQYEKVSCIHRGRIGLFAARQEGIKASNGEWILALDSDDRLKPGALTVLEEAINKENEAIDLVIFCAEDMDSGKRLFKHSLKADTIYSGASKRVLYEESCRSDAINSMWTKCINRRIAGIEHDGLYLNYGEDQYQTACYIDRADKVLFIDKGLYLYRDNAQSISASYSKVYLDNQKFVWNSHDEFIKKWECEDIIPLVKERKALTCSIAAAKLIYSGLSKREKEAELNSLLGDSFYLDNYKNKLPDWAPEENCFIHELQISDDPQRNLMNEGNKVAFKRKLKKLLGK